MSVLDLKFLDTSSNTIYDYATITSTSVADGTYLVKIQNLGDETLSNLGLYLTVASTVGGDVENPPDYTPQSAYQTIIDWGQATESGAAASGGLKVSYKSPTDGSAKTTWVTRSAGSAYKNRIRLGHDQGTSTYNQLPSGSTMEITLTLSTPPAISAKRLFVNIGIG